MIKKAAFFIILFHLIIVKITLGAPLHYINYTWNDNPELHKLTKNEKKKNLLFIKDQRIVEYEYDYNNDEVKEYYTIHKIIRVRSDDAVEQSNRVYIPMNTSMKLINPRARVITKKDVVEFDDANIKTMENYEGMGTFNFFALEGVEIDSEIEFIYTLKKSASYKGDRQILQSDVYKREVVLDVYSPQLYHLTFKTYNGLPKVQKLKNDSSQSFHHYNLRVENMPGLEPEDFAAYNNNLMRVDYKLDCFEFDTTIKVITYENAADDIIAVFSKKDFDWGDRRNLKNSVEEMEITANDDQKTIIRKVEDYLKEKFSIIPDASGAYFSLDDVFDTKKSSRLGFIRLFSSFFDYLSVPYKIGLTTDRFSNRFDTAFASYYYLQEYFFYFPDIDEYLAPTAFSLRLGYLPFEWTHNHGLFLKKVIYEKDLLSKTDIRYIPPLDDEKSKEVINATIHINDQFEAKIDMERILTGYTAMYVQPVYHYVPPDQKNEMANSLVKTTGEGTVIDNVEIKYNKTGALTDEPFVIKGKISHPTLIEKAGNKYLFRIGKVIGKQMELYQEDKRDLDIELDYNHILDRNLSFNIPNGYQLNNPKDLKKNFYYQNTDGQISMSFKSGFTQEDDTIHVKIHEFYDQLSYDMSVYPTFQKIINAAADFNKIVLIFEKK
jgi:hypothetical protein